MQVWARLSLLPMWVGAALPKSATLQCTPTVVSRMLTGRMSWWTTPLEWHAAKPAATLWHPTTISLTVNLHTLPHGNSCHDRSMADTHESSHTRVHHEEHRQHYMVLSAIFVSISLLLAEDTNMAQCVCAVNRLIGTKQP